MAAHTTEVVAYKKMSNGQWAFTIRCDGNADSDFPITLDGSVIADQAKKTAALDAARVQCIALFEQAQAAEQVGLSEIGKQVQSS